MLDWTLEFQNSLIFLLIPFSLLILMLLGLGRKSKIYRKLQMKGSLIKDGIRVIVITLGLILIVVALLGPRRLKGEIELNYESLDMFILMDVSRSMLVEDMKGSRLETEKKIVRQILQQLDGDRVGFIPFSSAAYVQMPLTNDYELGEMFLDVVDTDLIGGGGSDLEEAISLAVDSFGSSRGDQVILIVSDGEEHDRASEKKLEKLMEDNIKVYTIGIGTELGGPVPVYDEETGEMQGYKQDSKGNNVISRLEEKVLMNLAEIGNGKYYLASDDKVSESFIADLNSLNQDTERTKKIKQFQLLYQFFLGAGICVFLLSYLLPVRRKEE